MLQAFAGETSPELREGQLGVGKIRAQLAFVKLLGTQVQGKQRLPQSLEAKRSSYPFGG